MAKRLSPTEKAKRARARQVAKIDLHCRRRWNNLRCELEVAIDCARSLASGRNARDAKDYAMCEQTSDEYATYKATGTWPESYQQRKRKAVADYRLHFQRMAALTPPEVRKVLAQLKRGRS